MALGEKNIIMEKLIAIMVKLTRIDCIQFANIGWIYPIDYLVFMKLIIVKLTNYACKFTNNQK